jgi:hypothetical protein
MKSEIDRDIMEIDSALDALCHAAAKLGSTNDWIASAALMTLEGMIDDLGERVTELRAIRTAVRGVRNDHS